MATSAITVATEDRGLLPKPLRHLWNGTSYICEAFEIGCRGIRDTTQGIDEITSIMLKQHKDSLMEGLTRPPKAIEA